MGFLFSRSVRGLAILLLPVSLAAVDMEGLIKLQRLCSWLAGRSKLLVFCVLAVLSTALAITVVYLLTIPERHSLVLPCHRIAANSQRGLYELEWPLQLTTDVLVSFMQAKAPAVRIEQMRFRPGQNDTLAVVLTYIHPSDLVLCASGTVRLEYGAPSAPVPTDLVEV